MVSTVRRNGSKNTKRRQTMRGKIATMMVALVAIAFLVGCSGVQE